jgi:hypothetical protein
MPDAEFDTHAGFVQALHALVQAAVEQRARRLVLVDPTFEDWPLESTALLESLTAFVRLPGRQVLLFGRSFETLSRARPRLVAWRRTWLHAVPAARPADPETELPTRALADRALALTVRDREHWRGVLRAGSPEVSRLAVETDAWTQRSVPDFPAHVLGL